MTGCGFPSTKKGGGQPGIHGFGQVYLLLDIALNKRGGVQPGIPGLGQVCLFRIMPETKGVGFI